MKAKVAKAILDDLLCAARGGHEITLYQLHTEHFHIRLRKSGFLNRPHTREYEASGPDLGHVVTEVLLKAAQ